MNKKEKWHEIKMLRGKLSKTDYVVIKLQEYQFQGKDIQPLLKEYQPILAEREKLREEIRTLESKLK